MTITINKRFVDKLEYEEQGTNIYFDDKLSGFAVRVYKTSKTYVVQARVQGKVLRRTIGKHGHLTAEQARIEAQALLGLMARGSDPHALDSQQKILTVTLGEVFESYKSKRQLRPRTLHEYTNNLRRCVPDWMESPMTAITRDMVERRLLDLSSTRAQAGQCYRLLRSLFRFAAEEYEVEGKPILDVDPTRNLSRNRPWTEQVRRQSCIQRHQLQPWFEAVMGLERTTMRDYLLVCLLSGLRRTEAASLTWSNVCLEGRYIRVEGGQTKNHQEHRLPLSDFLYNVFAQRLKENELKSPFVFPGQKSGTHIQEVKRQINNVVKASGVKFTTHDLRRSFVTYAEQLDISQYALKRLLNHKDGKDVTSGYIVIDVERLRQPMQRITDFILEQAGVSVTTNKQKAASQLISVVATGST